uniref:Uncharacterized protein n=1 Tax=Pyxicephalus adspersus TaxID=30357 RepID=A0AAV3A8I9_PYXAD|nr:TPA: hypothetical protein GDO54_009976 [Pyxicephalus adspersus]
MLDVSLEAIWMDIYYKDPNITSTFMQAIENIPWLLKPDGKSPSLKMNYPNVKLDTVILNTSSFTGYKNNFNTTPSMEVYINNIKTPNGIMEGELMVTSIMVRNLGKILPSHFGDSVEGHDHSVSNRIVINNAMMSTQSLKRVNLDMVFGRRTNPSTMKNTFEQCVFWDYNLFEGVGGWSTEGCRTLYRSDITICRCNHLTSFSVLTSVGVHEDEVLETHRQVGTSFSILSLLICIIFYIVEWKTVVKDYTSFYRQTAMINISVSMLIADIWFLFSTFITETHENKLCIAAAFLQHFFYLASFYWMLFHGLILLHEMVFAFYQLVRKFMIPVMVIIGYVFPFVIAIVTLSLDYPKKAYIEEGDCFLDGEKGAVFAFSGPVLLITVLNFVVIGVMVWRTLRPPESEDQEEEDDGKALVTKAITILTSVFGITWILETLALTEETHEFFQYAFTLINDYQGVFILIFGCLLDKKSHDHCGELGMCREKSSGWVPSASSTTNCLQKTTGGGGYMISHPVHEERAIIIGVNTGNPGTQAHFHARLPHKFEKIFTKQSIQS